MTLKKRSNMYIFLKRNVLLFMTIAIIMNNCGAYNQGSLYGHLQSKERSASSSSKSSTSSAFKWHAVTNNMHAPHYSTAGSNELEDLLNLYSKNLLEAEALNDYKYKLESESYNPTAEYASADEYKNNLFGSDLKTTRNRNNYMFEQRHGKSSQDFDNFDIDNIFEKNKIDSFDNGNIFEKNKIDNFDIQNIFEKNKIDSFDNGNIFGKNKINNFDIQNIYEKKRIDNIDIKKKIDNFDIDNIFEKKEIDNFHPDNILERKKIDNFNIDNLLKRKKIDNFDNGNTFDDHDKYSPYLNVSNYPGEKCKRVCKPGDIRLCYFEFTLEFYQTMGIACGKCDQGVESDCNHPQCIVGDGIEKGVMSINRKSPGPDIQVCKDDIIVVDVHNQAAGTSAALHWHGVHMIDTPYMDGVPFVTQCPIPYSNSFRYQFRATEPGTQFYHSHAGHHKANGQFGALIIREPLTNDPLNTLYDYDLPEHHIFLADLSHVYAEHQFPGLDSDDIHPDSVTINGRGVFSDLDTQERTKVPPTIYHVQPGKRYRFRFINGINHGCPVQLQIEKHNFSIISTDSFSVLPQTIDTLISNAGERYDFIFEANRVYGDYWLRIRGLGVCLTRRIESYALIRYKTKTYFNRRYGLTTPPFPKYDDTYTPINLLNHPNASCPPEMSNRRITDLTALESDDDLRTSKPDHKFFLAFNNYVVPNEEVFKTGQYFHFANIFSNVTVVAAINNLSLVFPDYVPLTQPELMDESHFCDIKNKPAKCKDHRLCHCVHRLKVKRDSIVELIIVDESESANDINHPFHLHGYRFMVTGLGQLPSGVPMNLELARQMENDRRLLRNSFSNRPPFKDTVSIPSRGYVVLRLRASNPGFWLMHCHYEWHLSIGMGLILQVGEVSEMVKAPRDFPKCSNYLPSIKKSDLKVI